MSPPPSTRGSQPAGRELGWLGTSSPKARQDGEAGPSTPSWQGLSWRCVGGTA